MDKLMIRNYDPQTLERDLHRSRVRMALQKRAQLQQEIGDTARAQAAFQQWVSGSGSKPLKWWPTIKDDVALQWKLGNRGEPGDWRG